MKKITDNVFLKKKGKKRILLAKNLNPGESFFDEELINDFREWDPKRSKLAAIIMKGSSVPIKKNDVVLYLGASHGYTPSFVSDIVDKKGFVFCVDIAPRVVRDLVFLCEKRENMLPLLEDANFPERYKDKITNADIIYQDIAQKNQVEIFLKNIDLFLKNDGFALIAIKSRSIDVTKNPRFIFESVEKELRKNLKILDKKNLSPFQRDHMMFICQKSVK